MPSRRGRHSEAGGIRRHYPPPIRTTFQFVDHLHCGIRVVARYDRHLRNSSITSIPYAIRADLQPIESQIGSLRQMGLDRRLDLGGGVDFARIAGNRKQQHCQGGGQSKH